MESLSRSLVTSDPVRMPPLLLVPVVAAFTGLAVLASPVALAGSFTAYVVSAPRSGSAKDIPVALTANLCSSCKKDREKEGKKARTLTRLPIEVTQNKLFKRKGVPVRLCSYCDGEALESALQEHNSRL